MKMTLDLPDDLVKRVKLLALQEGKKLKDAAAELLRTGLAAARATNRDAAEPIISRDKKTGLPVIRCKQAAPAHQGPTPERVTDILLAQETDWHHAAGLRQALPDCRIESGKAQVPGPGAGMMPGR